MRTVIVAIYIKYDEMNEFGNYAMRVERVASSISARDFCKAFDVASDAIVKVRVVIIDWKDSVSLPSYVLSVEQVSHAILSVGLQFKK